MFAYAATRMQFCYGIVQTQPQVVGGLWDTVHQDIEFERLKDKSVLGVVGFAKFLGLGHSLEQMESLTSSSQCSIR